ncbi:hypothetical protein CC85DRAFT_302743 [Cutaneotrichosporon oleaginosum]|uniref:DUF4210 domain-containing protein n=1 Tax=Cutaneotrichosporon oleaginosum TaxID=879819 RepID=A0A0J0XLQ2_9TREE|nr:uncharacterized protein CC85DRAFT_302743 [Cutaneotrichosporon oleaginosum]KLT42022.1 hypothetical protein CC85DRAFT_302743 [Cutaneotrichosporon oleaginosum]TXT14322.1 hypothetical protein COLE_00515 [Cutaneotrichosporon oleaginosum]
MATHKPHCASQFALRVRAIATRPGLTPRAPEALILPFSATYYDLVSENEPPAATAPCHSPWVADVDLEAHYFTAFAEPQSEPPAYPGYRVPAIGQLQLLIKTSSAAVHAFVVPYDLSQLAPGARLLARERTYVSTGNGESLRYAVQLQFARVDGSFYLARTLKLVFSTAQETDSTQRTERADEVVPPSSPVSLKLSMRGSALRRSISSLPAPSPTDSPRQRRSSIEASSEWAAVRAQWRARATAFVSRGFEPPTSRPVSPNPVAPSARSLLSALAPDAEERASQSRQEKGEEGRVPTEKQRPPGPSRTPSVASSSRRRLSREERELSERLRAMDLSDK